jgi:hypothetical protein
LKPTATITSSLCDEVSPVGLILCSSAGQNFVRYTIDNLPSKVLAREYRLALPDEKRLANGPEEARRAMESKLKSYHA